MIFIYQYKQHEVNIKNSNNNIHVNNHIGIDNNNGGDMQVFQNSGIGKQLDKEHISFKIQESQLKQNQQKQEIEQSVNIYDLNHNAQSNLSNKYLESQKSIESQKAKDNQQQFSTNDKTHILQSKQGEFSQSKLIDQGNLNQMNGNQNQIQQLSNGTQLIANQTNYINGNQSQIHQFNNGSTQFAVNQANQINGNQSQIQQLSNGTQFAANQTHFMNGIQNHSNNEVQQNYEHQQLNIIQSQYNNGQQSQLKSKFQPEQGYIYNFDQNQNMNKNPIQNNQQIQSNQQMSNLLQTQLNGVNTTQLQQNPQQQQQSFSFQQKNNSSSNQNNQNEYIKNEIENSTYLKDGLNQLLQQSKQLTSINSFKNNQPVENNNNFASSQILSSHFMQNNLYSNFSFQNNNFAENSNSNRLAQQMNQVNIPLHPLNEFIKDFEEKSIERQFNYKNLIMILSQLKFISEVKRKIVEECVQQMSKYSKLLEQNLTINRIVKQLQYPPLNYYLMSRINTQDIYQYSIESNSEKVVWHVNFADNQLFGYCLTPLFAQDEIQCAEHPFLYTIRNAMQQTNIKQFISKTQEFNQPTPILIYNLPHQVTFDLGPSPQTPQGIYGNHFKNYGYDVIQKKTQVHTLDRPKTNLIAMAALQHGQGYYTLEQIHELFNTAFLAFRQAKLFSQREMKNDKVKVSIHTGNWGCGAFGNNMEIIALIQSFAAFVAKVDELHYHTFNQEGTQAYLRALKEQSDIDRSISLTQPIDSYVKQVLIEIQKRKYKWGVSDNN